MLDPVAPALRDRLEVSELPGYVEEEKLQIARHFLVPKQIDQHGLTSGQLKFSDASLRTIVREYTREAGVRNLEREIGSVCRKVAKDVAAGREARRLITPKTVATLLGPGRFTWGEAEQSGRGGRGQRGLLDGRGRDLAAVERR
jgi:ATP-dependent Lon protease